MAYTMDIPRSFLAMIENSVGSRQYQSLYFFVDGVSTDILNGGDVSCAVYVSHILMSFKLTSDYRAFSDKVIEDIIKFGWERTDNPHPGCVVYWGKMKHDDGSASKHNHVGFFIDTETAISSTHLTHEVSRHHITFGTLSDGSPKRDILGFYTHKDIRP